MDLLSTPLQNTSRKSESSLKRSSNIQWIIDRPRAGLAFRKKTRQILITRTLNHEELLIQYPGKESDREKNRRPWDFFPRLITNGVYGNDLDFQNIWEILYEGLQPLIEKDQEWAAIIATIFYRMAFMNDHQLSATPTKTTIRELSHYASGAEQVLRDEEKKIPPLYRYLPPRPIIQEISKIAPSWGGMSLEAFLHYNDLLAWNEDCKYYYRMEQTKPGTWIRDTGRINTLLSHLSIIGYLAGKLRFSDVCMKFARGKGVAPATRGEVLNICQGYVVK